MQPPDGGGVGPGVFRQRIAGGRELVERELKEAIDVGV
jgi:hypothetical protein